MEFDFYFFVFGKRRQLCDSDTFSEIFYVKFQCWFISSSSFSFLGSCAWTEMWREKINAKSNKIHLLCVVVSFVCVLLCARCVLCACVCVCVWSALSLFGVDLCVYRVQLVVHIAIETSNWCVHSDVVLHVSTHLHTHAALTLSLPIYQRVFDWNL